MAGRDWRFVGRNGRRDNFGFGVSQFVFSLFLDCHTVVGKAMDQGKRGRMEVFWVLSKVLFGFRCSHTTERAGINRHSLLRWIKYPVCMCMYDETHCRSF